MALRDDNINLHINVNSNEAQESIRKLSEVNRDLEKTNKAVRIEMEKLKAQSKEDSDEFRQLETAYKSNTAAMHENSKQIKELEKTLGLNDMTMVQLRKHAKELQSQLDRTVQSADPKGYANLQKQLEATQGRMGELKGAGQSLAGQLSNIPGPAGAVVKGIMGINTAFKILLANPIILIIAAVIALFKALYDALKSSEDATNKLNAILAPLRAIMDALLNVVQKCVGVILDFISVVVNGLMKTLESLPLVGKHFKQLNDFAKEAIQLEQAKQALEKKERQTLVDNAEAELKISKLRTEAKQKDKFSAQERMQMIEEAVKLEQEMADRQISNAREKLRIAEAEAERAENTTDTERKLAEMRAAAYQAEKTYYDHTRELTEQMNTAKNEVAAEEKQRIDEIKRKHQEMINSQLAAVDKTIAAERTKLMQERLDKKNTQKEFLEEMEKLELKALEQKLAIHGLEKEKRDEINQAILESKLKFQEEEENRVKELTEKLRLDALSKNEKELDDIRKKYEERQKLYQEGLDSQLISEIEYHNALNTLNDEMQAELDRKKEEQQTAEAAEKMIKIDEDYEQEKLKLLEQYADNTLTQEEYQQGLLELEQQFLDEKLRINGLSEEQITKLKEQQLNKQVAIQEKALKKQEDAQKKYTDLAVGAAGKFGEIFGNMAVSAGDTAEEMQYQMVMLALDTLKQIILMAATQAMANMVAQLGPIFGPIAGAAASELIIGAFEALKSKIKKPSAKNKGDGDTSVGQATGSLQVIQHAAGKYDVIGETDGKEYKEVPYIGTPDSGIVKNPALIAEQGEELIISSPDLQMLKKHVNYPYIVSAINEVRAGTVPQYAEGSYPISDVDTIELPEQQYDNSILERVAELLEDLKSNGVHSYIGMDEFDAQRKLRDKSRAIGTLKT